ncbi:hypothetical protein EGI16_20260 [Chryseobacterium sp. G0240]|uniref:hypothetical protein n=1 Tax=Chryseobacterium sp. G0240 TaxID=2487066 RepID=UPI000F456D2D|nr:hypothetical protein [Chryseobacterium sp. G0240]ROH98896.1 hypothetical protein EGI16_20260 [Chryseobacterium sp. G0240]
METTVQHQEKLQYAEVYISDLLALKNIFLQIQNVPRINQDFGVPFLLAKKKDEIMSVASLTLNEKKEIQVKIYDKKKLTEEERADFAFQAERYFKTNNAPNFRNPEQLKSSISSMISWLDF